MVYVGFEGTMFQISYVFLSVIFTIGFALECGISSGQTRQDLIKISSVCIKKVYKSVEPQTTNTTNDSDEEYDGFSYEYSSNSKEHSNSEEDKLLVDMFKKTEKGVKNQTMMDMVKENNNMENNSMVQNDTDVSDKCMVQCIFKKLNMLDDKGYPDHDKISHSLTINTENQQLKDFFQDSTDECFQLMEQGEDLDACDFATHFIKCLSEKGRSNCADWPLGELPFSHVF